MKQFGLVGRVLGHSWSPYIHGRILELLGQTGSYVLKEIEPDQLGRFLSWCQTEGWEGFNVTIPYKTKIMPYLDVISEEAKSIGAVNTVVYQDGQWIGYNTDYDGFGETFRRKNLSFYQKKVTILGYGGVAKAILAYVLAQGAADITVVSRQARQETSALSTVTFCRYEAVSSKTGDYIIQATPVGMYPHAEAMVMDADVLSGYAVAMDVIYNPLQTRFLREAKRRGLIAIDGLFMLVAQAIKAQEYFQNIHIPQAYTERIYNELKVKFSGV